MATLIEKSRRSTSVVIPAQILTKLTGFLYLVVLARYLSVTDYGIYNLITGSIIIFSFLTNYGLGSSLQRFIPEYDSKNDWAKLLKFASGSLAFRAIAGIVVFGISYILFDRLAPYFSVQTFKAEFILFAIGSFALFQTEFLIIIFNSIFLHKYSSVIQVVNLAGRFVLVSLLLLAGGSLLSVFVGELIAYAVGCIIIWYLFINKALLPHEDQIRTGESSIEVRRIFRYSAYNAGVIPGNILYSHSVDYFIIAALADAYQLGLYSLASRVSKMLTSILPQNILQSVIRPTFYQRHYSVADQQEELRRMFQTLVMFNAAFIFPIVAFASISAEPLIVLAFGEKYAGAAPVFVVFMLFNLFACLELASDLVLQTIEKVEARLYAQVFSIYNLVAALLLMPVYGVMGVAFATGSALMFKCLFFYIMVIKYTKTTLNWNSLLKIAVNTFIAGGVVKLVLLNGTNFFYLVLSILGGVAVYIVMLFLNNFMGIDDKKLVNQFVKRRLFNV